MVVEGLWSELFGRICSISHLDGHFKLSGRYQPSMLLRKTLVYEMGSAPVILLLSAIFVLPGLAETADEEVWYDASGEIVKRVKQARITPMRATGETGWEPAWFVRERVMRKRVSRRARLLLGGVCHYSISSYVSRLICERRQGCEPFFSRWKYRGKAFDPRVRFIGR